ncbi:MAG: cobyric acid synthase [bacterium]
MVNNKVKFIMIQGTSSSAGKSALTAGLLRYLTGKGFNCSPFKSQNMSLNSFVTEDGFEIAVSQAVQSEAAFKKPLRQINPILIKPSSDIKMHLIVEGRHFGNMNFKEFNRRKDFFLKKAAESFEFLTGRNDIIVVEGAGSPSEINLFKYDIANMGFAQLYDIPVILTADIERGGVFASIYGTVKLLPPKWRRLIKGFIINKFRGDASILEHGIKQMEQRLKIPCLGVVPHIKNLHIEAEDSLNLKKTSFRNGDNGGESRKNGRLNIGIVRLGHISNFNEFDPLFFDGRLAVRFFDDVPYEIDEFDMIIIPGSKSTVSDLNGIKKSGIFDYIKRFEKSGIIMGICGGFQMMGERITDPHNVESDAGGISGVGGLGFFKTETVLFEEKVLSNQKYRFKVKNRVCESFLDGYEIHNGRTFFAGNYSGGDIFTGILEPVKKAGSGFSQETGILSKDNKKIGTYIHGLFGNVIFKNFIIELVSENLKDTGKTIDLNYSEDKNLTYEAVKNDSFNLLSKNIEKHINIKLLREIIEI